MAKGSHKTWGGWETRQCHICGQRITLAHHNAAHHYENGVAFTLCGHHQHHYAKVRASLYRDPNQLTIQEAQ